MTSRILICRSNPIAPDPRVEKIGQALAYLGYSVTLLGWDRTAALSQNERISGLGCIRLPIKADFAQGIKNFPALLRWQLGLTRWLLGNRETYDIIHACDFDTVLPSLLVGRFFGKKVVYDIFDFYADHLRATPVWVKKVIKGVDMWVMNHVDAIILADDSRWDQIAGVIPKHSAVIYNTPPDSNVFEGQPSSNSGFRLAYVGLLQVERGILQILKVLQKHPDWSLDLAGFGGDESLISAEANGMVNVRWYGRVPYDQSLKISREADVLFATYDPAIPNHRYSSPNKIFEAMMLGKPIIVADQTNMDRIITRNECGLVVPYGDVDSLEKALVSLQSNPQLRHQLGQNGRSAYDSTYNWSIMQERLVQLYQRVSS